MAHTLVNKVIDRYAEIYSDSHRLKALGQNDSFDDMESLFDSIASNASSELYDGGYSGKFMYSNKCWGIVTDDLTQVIETAAMHGVTGAKFDSLGRQIIVYWPGYPYET